MRSIPYQVWHTIQDWGRKNQEPWQRTKKNVAYTLAGRIRNNSIISDYERSAGIQILDIVIEKAPELLIDIDEINNRINDQSDENIDITLELINKILRWDRKIKN